MPVFNAGPYLRPALESILCQSFQNWELIIIDDGSTDGCMSSISHHADPRIIRLRQDNAGKPVVMNRALALLRGEFWGVQDADDISHPRRLELQAQCLLTNPDVAGVFCGHDIIIDGRVLAPLSRFKSREQCALDIKVGSMPALDPTAMFRTSMVRGFQYSEDLPIVEGLDLVIRVGEQFPLLVLGACLYSYRIVASSVTRRDPEKRNALVLEMVRRMCARRGLSTDIVDRLRQQMARNPQNNDNGLAAHFTKSVADQVERGHRWKALRTGMQCWRLNPAVPTYAKAFLYAFLPRGAMRLYRQERLRRTERDWDRLTRSNSTVSS